MNHGPLAVTLMIGEPLLCFIALVLFRRTEDHKRFPAMEFYLALRVFSAPILAMLPYGPVAIDKHTRYFVYFGIYWAVYIVGAITIFFIIQQLFRYILLPLPGLAKLGVFVFRWASIVSVIVAVGSTVLPIAGKVSPMMLPNMGRELMRCMSVMELCLLTFFALSVSVLGLSFRSRAFGIALGFGMTSTLEFVASALFVPSHTLMTAMNIANQSALFLALGTWIVYAILPEPVRRPIMLPVSSPLMRWNEIATALGHGHTQVATTVANPGFLSDVERVVDKVLSKNSLNTAG